MTVAEITDTKALKNVLVEAQTVKALAEARFFDADAVLREFEVQRQPFLTLEAKADAEAAQLRTLIAEENLRQERFSTEASRIQAEELGRIEKNYLASNMAHHVCTFSEAIDDETVKQCISLLTTWDRKDPDCDIEIVFDCPGGEVWAGLHLFDFMVHIGKTHKLTTTAIGRTASMAAILIQAGNHRRMGANSLMMLHELSASTVGKSSDMEEQMQLIRKIEKNVIGMIASRSTLTEKSLALLWKKRDVWLDAHECLTKGLIDEIL